MAPWLLESVERTIFRTKKRWCGIPLPIHGISKQLELEVQRHPFLFFSFFDVVPVKQAGGMLI